jgi:hypothetical protein
MSNRKSMRAAISLAVLAAAGLSGCADTNQNPMTFFVTSAGSGKGADVGGLQGADAHCQKLASAAGAGNRTWRAYLSTASTATTPGVNAIDRIGRGPWRNAKGVVIATDIENLHGLKNNITKQTNLTEKGAVVNGRGDTPNTHDILTGSQRNGLAFPAGSDMTCGNYSQSGSDGTVQVGHSDRQGLTDDDYARSWNSSHASRGCSQQALIGTGGAGLFYCFAVN